MSSTLRFICTEDRYSTYLDDDDNEVYLAHGTRRRMFDDVTDLALPALWNTWRSDPAAFTHGYWQSGHLFLDYLRDMLVYPDQVDENVRLCGDCAEPTWSDETIWTKSENEVCSTCIQEYSHCTICEEYVTDTYPIIGWDGEACDRCRSNNCSYCEECDGYYHHDDADEHDHVAGLCCDSPATEFVVPNNGDGLLSNDTRALITLPAGVISDEGMAEIRSYLRGYAYDLPDAHEIHEDSGRSNEWRWRYTASIVMDKMEPVWQNRQGNFTKRLSRAFHQESAIKIPPQVLSQVGCIARDHSTAVDFHIETTRLLNLPAGDFAHEESCWWQSYYHGRCTLKTNGGFGIRTFRDETDDEVRGRVWVQPVKQDDSARGGWSPTFDVASASALLVFNGYGDLSGYVAPRILSHMMGMTYRKIRLGINPMYVNGDSGYIVAPEDLAAPFTDGSLDLRFVQHASIYDNERAVLANA